MANITINERLNMQYHGVYRDDFITRANRFIDSFLYSSAIEYNIILVGLIKSFKNLDEFSRPCCTVYSSELRDVNSRSDGKFYRTLEKAVDNLSKMRILVKNDKTGHLMYINIFNTCEKIDGNVRMTFSPEVGQFLKCENGNFSSIQAGYIFGLKGLYAKRLYEILHSHVYKMKYRNNLNIRYELAELQMMIGCIDIEDDGIKNRIEEKCSNATELLEKSVKKPMKWQKFKTRVLEPTLDQIACSTDINVSYDVEKNGRGGKVTHVIFTIKINDVVTEPTVCDIEFISGETDSDNVIDVDCQAMNTDEDSLIIQVFKILEDERISYKQAKDLLKASENDLNKIESAYEFSKSKDGINDLIGWLVKAIKEDWASKEIATPTKNNPFGISNAERAFILYDEYKESEELALYLYELNISSIEFEMCLEKDPDNTIWKFIQWKNDQKCT